MYLSYYKLNIEPFNISADPKFLWLGEKHKEALAALKYGILANKGFLLLTGDVGTGKTTLINALVNNLANEIFVATIHDPGLEKLDFLNFIAGAFKLKKNFKSKGEFVSYFSLFLRWSYEKNKKVLLIIDEAQRLNDDLLEEIRLLSNIEEQHTKLINIFFVGQNEFNEILIKKENRALRQRITLIHTLETLNKKETQEYIKYRLQVAGSPKNIFNLNAIDEIYSFSGGYPRLINIICDHALLTGFVKEKKVIDAQIIKECANELSIPIKSYEKENREPPPPVTGRNSKGITNKNTSRFTIRTVFLLMLLFLAAAAFYYQSGMDLTAVSIKNYRNRFIDARMVTKTESNSRAEQILEPDNTVIAYRIPTDHTLNQQETVISQPPSGPVQEKVIPDNPENIPAAENPIKLPMADIRTDIEAKKKSDKSDDVASFKKKINIYFDYNSIELSDEALSELKKFETVLSQNSDLNVMVKGYTDKTGKYSYNLKLSELRAAVVKNYLVGKGLNPLRIVMTGMGPDETIDDWGYEKTNQMNRRVEIELN